MDTDWHTSKQHAGWTPLDLNLRAKTWARRLWPVVALVTAVSVPATILARPDSLVHYRENGVACWLR